MNEHREKDELKNISIVITVHNIWSPVERSVIMAAINPAGEIYRSIGNFWWQRGRLFGSTRIVAFVISYLLFSFPRLFPGQFMHINFFLFPSLWRSSGHYSWLQYDRRVLDHEFPKKNSLPPIVHQHHHLQQLQPNNNHGNKCALVLYFLIKYAQFSISFTCQHTFFSGSTADFLLVSHK